MLCFEYLLASPDNIVSCIHVDHFGYLPSSKKIVVISDPVVGYNSAETFTCSSNDEFMIRDWFTDEIVFTGVLTPWNQGITHDQSGDIVWWFDFSALSAVGSYYVYAVDQNAASGRFEIADCVYDDALKHAVRAMYYQRCGAEKNAVNAYPAWSDDACHISSNQDVACHLVGDPNSPALDLSGGWHDAGDYNKYVNFAFEAMLDLCDAFAMNPSIWTDDFNIPESGNGVPDILDEIKYELDWLLKMQNDDGSVFCMVGAEEYGAASPPSADAIQRVHGPASTASSLSAAAMFAAAAPLFTGDYAIQLSDAAANAWNWANQNPDVVFYNSGVIVSGEQQTDVYETNMRKMIAAVYLYDSTGESIYREYVENNYTEAHMIQWQFVYPFETAIQNSLVKFSLMADVSVDVANAIQSVYTSSLEENNPDNLPAYLNATDAYMAYMADQNYTWGSNTFKARQAMSLMNMTYYGLSENVEYNNASEGYLHYFHGVNPNGICFLTNMNGYGAEKSVNSIYHGWFANGSLLWDEVGVSVYGPAPGFVPGGVNPTYSLDACCSGDCGSSEANAMCDASLVTPPLGQPIQKSWRDWNGDWPQNSWTVTEIGIYTQAAYIKLLSQFVGENCLSTSDIAVMDQKISLHLFPNPCENEFVLSTELLQAGNTDIEILDCFGKTLRTMSLNSRSGKSAHIIDTSELSSGTYILKIKSGNALRSAKFVVLK